MTNYKRIKGLTFGEMGQLLLQCPCDVCYFREDECGHAPGDYSDCKVAMQHWLESEVEDE